MRLRSTPDLRGDVATITTCSTAGELRAWLLRFARGLGFYGARYVHIGGLWWSLEQTATPRRFLTTSDRRDNEEGNWLARDPCIARVQTGFAPFAWTTRPSATLTEAQRRWLESERACGISAGVAVPVQDSASGPAYLSFFGIDECAVADLIDRHGPELAFVAAQFHLRAKSLVRAADGAPALSPREIEVLRLAAKGMTYQESADVLGISPRTVEYHLRRASEKLGAVTKTRAVVLALGMGLADG